ncbi:hypothetical protein ACRALDRAFT_2052144 [Sodiomyces alcalophilus JCM 7366]|uniref:uncharacterized protein n=1 Tax=Sodiomyces alcalophilus JCM 7366 TaxID=591952 RepID=UPI0039B37D83
MASPGAIVPARLGFLAIFNPSLGKTDETIDDQIVYYASVNTQRQRLRRRHRSRGKPTEHLSQEERNERLRQIGLAQGVIEFSRSFSGGVAVDAIDTEKARVILHELEPGWWILASIDLTRVPLPPKLPTGRTGVPAEEIVEYSSREIKPAALLRQDLLRAHSVFLLHHDSSLSSFFRRSQRSRFVTILSRYWDLFLSTWNVMLHGNPTRNVFNGINLAASGELGIGVGEEERGSGEREVLEGLVGRVEGLVDLVVSRFGSHDFEADEVTTDEASRGQWLGTGQEPGPDDGAIFLGTGALSRESLRDVTHWMEDIYTWGEHAYGIIESPTSTRPGRRAKKSKTRHVAPHSPDVLAKPPSLPLSDGTGAISNAAVTTTLTPAPITTATTTTNVTTTTTTLAERSGQNIGTVGAPGGAEPQDQAYASEAADGHLDKLMSYMKLGYGTYWAVGNKSSESSTQDASRTAATKTNQRASQKSRVVKVADDTTGYYLIGLLGRVEEGIGADVEEDRSSDESAENSRTMVRTAHVELEESAMTFTERDVVRELISTTPTVTPGQGTPTVDDSTATSGSTSEKQVQNGRTKVRVVVYVNKPFIFTFLFRLHTDSLAWDTLYRSLHYQMAPLRKPLLASTKYRPERPDVGPRGASIREIIWDPVAMTVHNTIPNIPDPTEPPAAWSSDASAAEALWTRAEAMNTHMQLLNTYSVTRSEAAELERTCKTNRGWWVVWTRVLSRPPMSPLSTTVSGSVSGSNGPSSSLSDAGTSTTEDGVGGASSPVSSERRVRKEVFLIRKASDHAGTRGRGFSGAYLYGETGGDGSSRLVGQGIGVDTRRYIEGLLSLPI